MSADRYRSMEWETYLALVEERHGREARELAEKHGSALAGDTAQLMGRQRISRRLRHWHRSRER